MGYHSRILLPRSIKFKNRVISNVIESLRLNLNKWKSFSTSSSVITDDNFGGAIKQPARLKFHDIPAARRLPFIGTKLDYLLAGSGRK